MSEIANGMVNVCFRMPSRIHSELKKRARLEKRSQASVFRESLNKYIVEENTQGRFKKAFLILDWIMDGGKKDGVVFLDQLSNYIGETEEDCKHLAVVGQRILFDYNIRLGFPSIENPYSELEYFIDDKRTWSRLYQKYRSIRKKFKSECDVGFKYPTPPCFK